LAIEKIPEQWKGVRRLFGSYYVETCYDVYADMASESSPSYLCMNGFSIYGPTKDSIADRLPFTIAIKVGSGETHTFTTSASVMSNGYSSSGNWMAYYVKVSSETEIQIPNNGSEFSISVTVTESGGVSNSFTEAACGVLPVDVTVPEYLLTGRAYAFNCSRSIPGGAKYHSSGSLHWEHPYERGSGTYYKSACDEHWHDAYVDPFTSVSNATQAFNKFYFAVFNTNCLPEASETRAPVEISFQTKYYSSDFSGGITILLLHLTTEIRPRSFETDSDLYPEIDISKTIVTGSPQSAVINGKYLANSATITIQPSVKYKYMWTGDVYKNAYAVMDFSADSGTSTKVYIRNGTISSKVGIPRTWHDDMAEQVESGASIWVQDMWCFNRAIDQGNRMDYGISGRISISILLYWAPVIKVLNVYRCKRDTSGSYSYGGYRYSKDDYGAYCLAEYEVVYNKLDGTNTTTLQVQYNKSTINVTTSGYTETGYVVIPADTEHILDVTLIAKDKLTTDGVRHTQRLSTAGVIMDYLNGGNGISFGKVAERQSTLDINPEWTLMFYKAVIQNFDGGSANKDLVAWMKSVDAKITDLQNNYRKYYP